MIVQLYDIDNSELHDITAEIIVTAAEQLDIFTAAAASVAGNVVTDVWTIIIVQRVVSSFIAQYPQYSSCHITLS